MESKYYTPDISDLFLGYECEKIERDYSRHISIHINSEDPKDWDSAWGKIYQSDLFNSKPYILKQEDIIEFLGLAKGFHRSQIRTPYLTREQIEKDGWSFNKDNYGSLEFSNWDYEMSYRSVTRILNIIKGGSKPPTELYYGKCPSINEFRKICKLVI